MDETTTIRISKKTKKELDDLKGIGTYNNIIEHLIEFFLTKK